LAVSGDRLLVAWTSDNGGSPNNLDIRYRVVGLDGTPLTDVIELAATRAGVAVVGNAMSPSLAAINGGWLLAGQWGHADATAFQAFVVELDANGAVQGDASDVELDTVNGQTEVSIAVDGSDTLVAWQEDSTSSSAPSAWSAVLGNAPVELADPGARPHVGAGPWYVWDDESGAVGVQPPGVAAKALSLAGQVHSAKIGVVGDQATLMWLKVESGISNSVHLAPLAADGTIGTNVSLASTTVPSVYPLDLTMVDATHAVVVYQDGTTPDFRLKADFITVPR
jgi:hypothetical protein